MLIATGGARRKASPCRWKSDVDRQHEKVPISADRARNGKFASTPRQRGVRNEPSPEVMLVSPIFRDLPILLGRVRMPVRHPQPAKSQAGPEGNAEDPRNHTSSPVWRDFRRVA